MKSKFRQILMIGILCGAVAACKFSSEKSSSLTPDSTAVDSTAVIDISDSTTLRQTDSTAGQ